MNPVKADIVAPIPIITAIPKPDALPASLGFMETIPDEALGNVIPLPNPISIIGPKNVNGLKNEVLENII